MVAMLGAVSMVIDAGVYFVLQRQLQNAADAAALAAVWYKPACPPTAPWVAAGCQTTISGSPAPQCNPFLDPFPCTAAVETAQANWGQASLLCQGPNLPAGTIPVNISTGAGQVLNLPNVQPYVVTLSCDAPHWFARVLPGVNLTMKISVSSAAALGWLGSNGQLVGDPPPPNARLVARLIL
jgi:hypothetical protein